MLIKNKDKKKLQPIIMDTLPTYFDILTYGKIYNDHILKQLDKNSQLLDYQGAMEKQGNTFFIDSFPNFIVKNNHLREETFESLMYESEFTDNNPYSHVMSLPPKEYIAIDHSHMHSLDVAHILSDERMGKNFEVALNGTTAPRQALRQSYIFNLGNDDKSLIDAMMQESAQGQFAKGGLIFEDKARDSKLKFRNTAFVYEYLTLDGYSFYSEKYSSSDHRATHMPEIGSDLWNGRMMTPFYMHHKFEQQGIDTMYMSPVDKAHMKLVNLIPTDKEKQALDFLKVNFKSGEAHNQIKEISKDPAITKNLLNALDSINQIK